MSPEQNWSWLDCQNRSEDITACLFSGTMQRKLLRLPQHRCFQDFFLIQLWTPWSVRSAVACPWGQRSPQSKCSTEVAEHGVGQGFLKGSHGSLHNRTEVTLSDAAKGWMTAAHLKQLYCSAFREQRFGTKKLLNVWASQFMKVWRSEMFRKRHRQNSTLCSAACAAI